MTPSFQQGEFIERAIASVLEQGLAPGAVEHIVMDGGSTDGTLEVLRRHPHLRWTSAPDRGQADALRRGLAAAKGQILAWLCADDFYLPGALATVAEAAGARPAPGLVIGRALFVDERGRATGTDHPSGYGGRARLIEVWRGHNVPQPATFFAREAYERAGPVDETLRFPMDLDLFIRMAGRERVRVLDLPIACYRLQPGSKTVLAGEAEILRQAVDVSRRYWGRGVERAMFACSYAWHRAIGAPLARRAHALLARARTSFAERRPARGAACTLGAARAAPALAVRVASPHRVLAARRFAPALAPGFERRLSREGHLVRRPLPPLEDGTLAPLARLFVRLPPGARAIRLTLEPLRLPLDLVISAGGPRKLVRLRAAGPCTVLVAARLGAASVQVDLAASRSAKSEPPEGRRVFARLLGVEAVLDGVARPVPVPFAANPGALA